MKVVFTHASPLVAQAARDELLRHGILASVVSRTEGMHAGVAGYDVLLCYGRQADDAALVLGEPGWWRADEGSWAGGEEPDLSLLDASLAPECPACGEVLPLEAGLGSCPSCGAAVDVAELIATSHGPEALAGCYEESAPALAPDAVERLSLLCPRCQYDLSGLPRASTCPECGRAYDKDRIVREFLSG